MVQHRDFTGGEGQRYPTVVGREDQDFPLPAGTIPARRCYLSGLSSRPPHDHSTLLVPVRPGQVGICPGPTGASECQEDLSLVARPAGYL